MPHANVYEYLESLPEDRRATLAAVREVILRNLDKGYEEGIQYGMIGYYVPHRVYPAGYHCDPKQPLPFICLASQKSHMALYMMGLYIGADGGLSDHRKWFEDAVAASGKRLDMGKSCIRFKRLEDLPLDVIGESIRRLPAREYIALYERVLAARGADSGASRSSATKAASNRTGARKAASPPARATGGRARAPNPKKAAAPSARTAARRTARKRSSGARRRK